MADKAETGGAPTTKQTLIVALALGVVAGGGGGFLGYMLGGRVAPVDKNATAETQEAGADKKEIEPKAAEASAAAADHGADKHGAKNAHASPHGDEHAKADGDKPKSAPPDLSKMTIKELTPIVTNLAAPANNWIRLQSAIVFNPEDLPHPDKMIAELTSDITGYLRTVSMVNLEGAEGLRRLQDELSERATIRSNGKIHEFIIETMVVQ